MNIARIPVMETSHSSIGPASPVLTKSEIEPLVKCLIPVVERYIEHEWSNLAQSVNPAIGADRKHLHIDFNLLHFSFGDDRRGFTVSVDVAGAQSLWPITMLADRVVEEVRKHLPPGFSLQRLAPKSWIDVRDLGEWSMMRFSQDD